MLVWGRVLHDPFFSNLAREIVFDLGLPPSIHAWLVSNNCITSLHAAVDVMEAIRAGRAEIGIAGGVESMSTVPVLFGREASRLFLAAGTARSAGERLKILLRLRPRHFKPVPLGFKEPSTGLTMGEHGEISAQEWKISREEQDEIAYRSHRRAAALAAARNPGCRADKPAVHACDHRGRTTVAASAGSRDPPTAADTSPA